MTESDGSPSRATAGDNPACREPPRSARFMGSEKNRANRKPKTALNAKTASIHAMIGPR